MKYEIWFWIAAVWGFAGWAIAIFEIRAMQKLELLLKQLEREIHAAPPAWGPIIIKDAPSGND